MTLGESIRAARQDAGLSLEAVAERTRIRRAILESIERDDFDASGGPVYARGHIRSIATAVGVDPAPWLEQLGGEVAAPAPPVMSDPVERAQPRSGVNWTAAMAVLLVLLVGAIAWRLLAGGDDAATPVPSATSTPGTSIDASASAAPTSPATTSSPTPSPTQPVSDGVTVVVQATGESWLAATEGGDDGFRGLLSAGDSREFRDDDEVSLVIGNAAAVQLTVNGTDLGAPGAAGEVVRLTFGPGSPSAPVG